MTKYPSKFVRKERIDRNVKTKEDWYPTFDDGTVIGSVLHLAPLTLRICFWGADDHGMERDITLESKDAFNEEWDRRVKWLSGLKSIDHKTLESMKFIPC